MNDQKNLDIDNFERVLDLAHHTPPKFILTSPRSLKACEALSIKPNEILPLKFTLDINKNNNSQEPTQVLQTEKELGRQSIIHINTWRKA